MKRRTSGAWAYAKREAAKKKKKDSTPVMSWCSNCLSMVQEPHTCDRSSSAW